MKRLAKILGVLLIVLILVIGGAIMYITKALPDIPVQKELKVELTPQRVAGVQPKQVSGEDRLEAALDGLLFLVGDLSERSARRRGRQQA